MNEKPHSPPLPGEKPPEGSGEVTGDQEEHKERRSPLFRVFESRFYLWGAALTALVLVIALLLVVLAVIL